MSIISAFRGTAGRTLQFLHREALLHLPVKVLERCLPRDVVAFTYHAVAAKPLPHICHLYPHKTPTEFEADVVYLKSRYHLPTWNEFVHNRNTPHQSGRQTALLTFDDGLSQCFDYVRPILLKHKVPGIFFITKNCVDNQHMLYRHKASLCIERVTAAAPNEQSRLLSKVGQAFGIGEFSATGFATWINGLEIVNEDSIDQACELLEVDIQNVLARQKPYLTTEQIKQLAVDGFTIGGHSICHGRLQLFGAAEVEREIVESCEFIQQLVGTRDVPFAFPFNGKNLDRQFLNSIVQRHPFIQCLFDTAGLATDAPFIIHRIGADEPAEVPPGRSGLKWLIRSFFVNQLCRTNGQ